MPFNLGKAFTHDTTFTGEIVLGSIKDFMVQFGPGLFPETMFPTYDLKTYTMVRVVLKGPLLDEMDTVRADSEWDEIIFHEVLQGDMFNAIPALPEVKETLLAMKQAAFEGDRAAYMKAYHAFDEAVIASYSKFLEL